MCHSKLRPALLHDYVTVGVAQMKMRKIDKKQSSGQVILIAVLAMALILLSTQIYVFEVHMSTVNFDSNSLNDYFFAIKLGSRNVVIGSIANVSEGGSNTVLVANLDKLAALVNRQNQFGRSTLNYTVEKIAPYSSGVWLFSGTDGFGVSSAFSHFTFNLSDREVDADSSYFINVTTALTVKGNYRTMLADEKQVNVTVNLLNEGEPALASQVTLYYRILDTWLTPNASNNYVFTDYGNGTYSASFLANIPSPTVEVSVSVRDQRQILVQANATCSQI
jgi:hypothetical protein